MWLATRPGLTPMLSQDHRDRNCPITLRSTIMATPAHSRATVGPPRTTERGFVLECHSHYWKINKNHIQQAEFGEYLRTCTYVYINTHTPLSPPPANMNMFEFGDLSNSMSNQLEAQTIAKPLIVNLSLCLRSANHWKTHDFQKSFKNTWLWARFFETPMTSAIWNDPDTIWTEERSPPPMLHKLSSLWNI